MSDNPHARMWELMRGFMSTQALHVAAHLGVADELAGGPRPVGEIAERLGADADAVYRFLRALAGEGVFAEDEPGVFRNTAASELLRRESSWHDMALLFGTVWYRTFGEALHAARAGEATFPRVFGTDWWSWLAQNPEEGERFNRGMHGEGKAEYFAEVEWRDSETVVDVGGGNGALLIDLRRLDLSRLDALADARRRPARRLGLVARRRRVLGLVRQSPEAVPAHGPRLRDDGSHTGRDRRS
jgi:methyltransferase family protein/O-methyltransferase